jgi:predicted DCC family thiol-disulfide oxidoreductase YuxK
MNTGSNARPVILFDAGCNLCRGAVTFVRRQGGDHRFRFVPLDSAEAASFLSDGAERGDTIHLIDGEGRHDRSTAVLRIAGRLRRPWASLRILRFVPRGLRDAVYDLVARYRIRWFGRAGEDSRFPS